jgi:hypothetical protein
MEENMRIDEKTFNAMPAELQALFIKLPNPARAEVVDLFPQVKTGKPGIRHVSSTFLTHVRDMQVVTAGGDSGSAARFFKQIPLDNECSLCHIPLCEENNKEDICKDILAKNVEKNSTNFHQTGVPIVLSNVMEIPKEKIIRFVKFVGDLCEKCAINFVHEVVEIKNWGSSKEGLQAIQVFIGNFKKCILIQNLVFYVEAWESIDTTPTTISLLKLFGSANHTITKYIQETRKSAPSRLIYNPKASPGERNAGLDGMDVVNFSGGGGTGHPKADAYGALKIGRNFHPTVKPIELMKYLCRLVTPPNGTVLDPFMGSGSTGCAAVQEGFHFIGMELEAEYIEIAQARINAVLREIDISESQKKLKLVLREKLSSTISLEEYTQTDEYKIKRDILLKRLKKV